MTEITIEDAQQALLDIGQYDSGQVDGWRGPLMEVALLRMQAYNARVKPQDEPDSETLLLLMSGNLPRDGRLKSKNHIWTSEANSIIEAAPYTGGDKFNPVVRDWTENQDGFPIDNWAGRFVAYCLHVGLCGADIEPLRPFEDFTGYGEETAPCYGAIATFDTAAGTYVGFLHRSHQEDPEGVPVEHRDELPLKDVYEVTGGFDGGQVGRVYIPKSQLKICRWPVGTNVEKEYFDEPATA